MLVCYFLRLKASKIKHLFPPKKKKGILECVILELILENILLLEVITLYHLDTFVL